MNLNESEVAIEVIKALEVEPVKAERFTIHDNLEIDLLEFKNKPFDGVNSIVTNGVSSYCKSKPIEFILTFAPNTLRNETDLFAFMATYLQLHYLPNIEDVKLGDHFLSKGRLINGLEFAGIYTTEPCYFHSECFMKLPNVKFLWLIPIYKNEYEFIIKNGTSIFEGYLEDKDPDLSLFNRTPLKFNN